MKNTKAFSLSEFSPHERENKITLCIIQTKSNLFMSGVWDRCSPVSNLHNQQVFPAKI